MTTIRVNCDKCGVEVIENRIMFEVRTGELRLRRPQVDLCGPCSRLFDAWLGTAPKLVCDVREGVPF